HMVVARVGDIIHVYALLDQFSLANVEEHAAFEEGRVQRIDAVLQVFAAVAEVAGNDLLVLAGRFFQGQNHQRRVLHTGQIGCKEPVDEDELVGRFMTGEAQGIQVGGCKASSQLFGRELEGTVEQAAD